MGPSVSTFKDLIAYLELTQWHRLALLILAASLGIGMGVGFSVANSDAKMAAEEDYNRCLNLFVDWQMRLTDKFSQAGSYSAAFAAFAMSSATEPANLSAPAAERIKPINPPAFMRLAKEFYTQLPGLYSMQLQSGGVVSQAYPVGSIAVGLDIINLAVYKPIYKQLIEEGLPVTAGPTPLQSVGGLGVSVRYPIFLSADKAPESFWGVGNVLMKVVDFLNATGINVLPREHNVDYVMWFTTEVTSPTGNGNGGITLHREIIKSSYEQESDTIIAKGMQMQLPLAEHGKSTYVTLYPRGGYVEETLDKKTVVVIVVATIFAAFGLILVLYTCLLLAFIIRHRNAPRGTTEDDRSSSHHHHDQPPVVPNQVAPGSSPRQQQLAAITVTREVVVAPIKGNADITKNSNSTDGESKNRQLVFLAILTLRGAQPLADRAPLEAVRVFNAFFTEIKQLAKSHQCYAVCEIGDRSVYVVSKSPAKLYGLARAVSADVVIEGGIRERVRCNAAGMAATQIADNATNLVSVGGYTASNAASPKNGNLQQVMSASMGSSMNSSIARDGAGGGGGDYAKTRSATTNLSKVKTIGGTTNGTSNNASAVFNPMTVFSETTGYSTSAAWVDGPMALTVSCRPAVALHACEAPRAYDPIRDVYFYGSSEVLSIVAAAVDQTGPGEVSWTPSFEEALRIHSEELKSKSRKSSSSKNGRRGSRRRRSVVVVEGDSVHNNTDDDDDGSGFIGGASADAHRVIEERPGKVSLYVARFARDYSKNKDGSSGNAVDADADNEDDDDEGDVFSYTNDGLSEGPSGGMPSASRNDFVGGGGDGEAGGLRRRLSKRGAGGGGYSKSNGKRSKSDNNPNNHRSTDNEEEDATNDDPSVAVAVLNDAYVKRMTIIANDERRARMKKHSKKGGGGLLGIGGGAKNDANNKDGNNGADGKKALDDPNDDRGGANDAGGFGGNNKMTTNTKAKQVTTISRSATILHIGLAPGTTGYDTKAAIDVIDRVVTSERGTIVSAHATTIVVAFNLMGPAGRHEDRAANCVLRLRRLLSPPHVGSEVVDGIALFVGGTIVLSHNITTTTTTANTSPAVLGMDASHKSATAGGRTIPATTTIGKFGCVGAPLPPPTEAIPWLEGGAGGGGGTLLASPSTSSPTTNMATMFGTSTGPHIPFVCSIHHGRVTVLIVEGGVNMCTGEAVAIGYDLLVRARRMQAEHLHSLKNPMTLLDDAAIVGGCGGVDENGEAKIAAASTPAGVLLAPAAAHPTNNSTTITTNTQTQLSSASQSPMLNMPMGGRGYSSISPGASTTASTSLMAQQQIQGSSAAITPAVDRQVLPYVDNGLCLLYFYSDISTNYDCEAVGVSDGSTYQYERAGQTIMPGGGGGARGPRMVGFAKITGGGGAGTAEEDNAAGSLNNHNKPIAGSSASKLKGLGYHAASARKVRVLYRLCDVKGKTKLGRLTVKKNSGGGGNGNCGVSGETSYSNINNNGVILVADNKANDEWMYQVQDDEENCVFSAVNTIFMRLASDDYCEAERLWREFLAAERGWWGGLVGNQQQQKQYNVPTLITNNTTSPPTSVFQQSTLAPIGAVRLMSATSNDMAATDATKDSNNNNGNNTTNHNQHHVAVLAVGFGELGNTSTTTANAHQNHNGHHHQHHHRHSSVAAGGGGAALADVLAHNAEGLGGGLPDGPLGMASLYARTVLAVMLPTVH